MLDRDLDALVAAQAALDDAFDSHLATGDVFAPRDGLVGRAQLARWGFSLAVAAHPAYRSYAEATADVDGLVAGDVPLHTLPLLPTPLFKRPDVEVGDFAGAEICRSSGTRGSVSRVPRDDRTLERFISGCAAVGRSLLGVEHRDARILNLGASSSAAPVWVSYVVDALAISHMTIDVETTSTFDQDVVVEKTAGCDVLVVIGPPHRILHTARANPGLLDHVPDALVVTIGGWKAHEHRKLAPTEFREAVAGTWGLSDDAMRDGYSMVELNSVLLECGCHRKHVPPWLVVFGVHPSTGAVCDSGEEGLLAFVDPTASSYPCFLLSEDFGTVVSEMSCECGRIGPVVEVTRRVRRGEGRGCALRL